MKIKCRKICCLFLVLSLILLSGCASVDSDNKDKDMDEKPTVNGIIDFKPNIDTATPFDRTEAQDITRIMAEDGAVLIKNDNNALPLVSTDKVAVFGSSQLKSLGVYAEYGYRVSGAGSGAMYGTPDKSPLEEINNKASENKFRFYSDISTKYLNNPTDYVPTDADIKAAKKAGVNKVIYIISRLEGEDKTAGKEPDVALAKGGWYLSDAEEKMLYNLKSNFNQVIVVLNIGSIIDTNWIVNGINGKQVCDSVLISWYGGLEAPEALANVLCGDVTPSGKLADTAADINSYPSTKDFYKTEYTEYTEDIFVGYRYFETFNKPVNFEFGFGLSYTQFDITNTTYKAENGKITVTAKVTNRGKYSGKEVVQVYFGGPQMNTGDAVLSKPSKELAGFVKTKLLKPNESQTVTVVFDINDMSSYDDTGKTAAKSAYVLEKGDYNIFVGNSVKNVTKVGTYKVDKFTVVEQLTQQMSPYQLPQRLLADGTYETLITGSRPEAEILNYKNDVDKDAAIIGETKILYSDVATGKNTLDEFLNQMTLEELISFTGCSPSENSCQESGVGGSLAVRRKFEIPVADTQDGPGGPTSATHINAFGPPSATMLACTWDVSLAADYGVVVGKFGQEKNIHFWLAPSVNIHRNPLCGRNFEYYSEDPLLAGYICTATVENSQAFGIACVVKHFAANNKETARGSNDSRVSERALREIYLKPFEITVKKGNPVSIMTSYNKINGLYSYKYDEMLTAVARGEWGFNGMFMSDWGGYDKESTAEFEAGLNVRMGEKAYPSTKRLLNAYKSGQITRDMLEENAKYILSAMLRIKSLKYVAENN